MNGNVRFIAVAHYWFMRSEGFQVFNLSSSCDSDAESEAALLQLSLDAQFKHCAVHVVKLGDGEALMSRKLTLKERFFGRVFEG